jgi:solute carrier family 13 (sodium-dependent dicarboxylate transporter), member 2/3/5
VSTATIAAGAAPRGWIKNWGVWLQFVVSFGFILPVNAPQNTVAYGTDTFAARDFVRTGIVITIGGYALILVLAATYWSWLGYL